MGFEPSDLTPLEPCDKSVSGAAIHSALTEMKFDGALSSRCWDKRERRFYYHFVAVYAFKKYALGTIYSLN